MTTALSSARGPARKPGKPIGLIDLAQALFLLALLLFITFPLFWMVTTSLKVQNETFSTPPRFFNFTPTLEHYQTIIEEGEVPRTGLNSLIVATGTTILAVILGTPAAYVFARFQFRGKRDLWFWFISNRFISPVVVVLAYFLVGRDLRLLDSHLYLILIYQTFTVPLVIWLCLDQFRSVPKDIDDAAKVDGCNLLQTFWRINLPLALPGIVVSAILSFIFSWNEMLFGLLLTRANAVTAPVQASTFMTGMGIRWGDMMATGTLIVLPVIIFAALVSRHLVRGLTMGAVK